MYQVAIHCPVPSDEASISEIIEANYKIPVFTTRTIKALRDLVAHKAVNLLVYDVGQFSDRDFEVIQEARGSGLAAPTLVVARSFEKDPIPLSLDRAKVLRLERPFETKDLLGLSRKLLHFRHAGQRIHRRFYTVETAQIETFASGQSVQGNLLNISRGGAYCECSENPRLSQGDMVRININLSQMQRDYAFFAKVVWTTRRGVMTGGPGFGFQFVKPNDVYSGMMKKM